MKRDEKIGLVSRAAHGAKKEVLDLPENILNLPHNTIGRATRYLIKKFGPEKAAKMVENLEKDYEKIYGQETELGKLGKKSGFIKEIPEAETYKEKVAENLGKGFVDILSAGGALKTLSSLPKAITSVSGLLSQSFAQPKIKEIFPNSPLVQTTVDFLLGLTGAAAGSKLAKTAIKPKNIELPKATAGQLAPLGSERSDKLLAKQLNLAKKDYKSAKALQNIQNNQQQEVIDLLKPKSETKASHIVESIVENFENLKKTRRDQYQADKNRIFSNFQGNMDVQPTFDLIDELAAEASKGGKIEKVLSDIGAKIHLNKDSLANLNNTKTEIQGLTQGFGKSELHLSDQQAALINKVAHQLGEDIERSVPEIAKMNSNYSKQSNELNKLQNGIVGKSVKKAALKPSEIFKNIFEKTDPEKIIEFKSVIPDDLYEKAADHYLGDVLNDSLGKPSRNITNRSNKFFDLRSKLEKNKEQLNATLPEKYRDIVDESINKIQVSERGVPRNDFTIDTNRTVAVGDEAKGLGIAKNYLGQSIPSLIGGGAGYVVGGLPGAIVGTAVGKGASEIGKSLRNKTLRKEMLTGLSPTQQVTASIANKIPQTLQQTLIAKSLNREEKPSLSEIPQEKTLATQSGIEVNNISNDMNDYFQTLSSDKESPKTDIGKDMDDYFQSLGKKKSGTESKRKILHITPQKGKFPKGEFKEEEE